MNLEEAARINAQDFLRIKGLEPTDALVTMMVRLYFAGTLTNAVELAQELVSGRLARNVGEVLDIVDHYPSVFRRHNDIDGGPLAVVLTDEAAAGVEG